MTNSTGMMGPRRRAALLGMIVIGMMAGFRGLRAQTTRTAPATRPAAEVGPGDKPWMRLIPPGTFRPAPPRPRPALPEEVENAFVIPVHGVVDDSLLKSIRRKVTRCKGQGARLVVFDINSPGGLSDAMQKITGLIENDLSSVRTVAFVHPEAISAAAIIALSCDEIVASTSARFGDSMPIAVGPGGSLVELPDKERGKIESYLRAAVRAKAQRGGYNVALCEAMVTIDMIVWLVENRATGELRVVHAGDWRDKTSDKPARDSGAAESEERSGLLGRLLGSEDKDRQQAEWKYLATIDGPDELVTLTGREMKRLGFTERSAESMDEIKKLYGVSGELTVLEDNWSERLVAFLTSPVMATVLLIGGIVCIYVEMRIPGFGVFGISAVICFALLFGSQYLIGLANWWEIALFGLGLVLIALEVFVIPGFGVAGVSGMLCCLVAMVGMIVANAPDELPVPRTDLDWSLFENGLLVIMVAVLLSAVGLMALSKYFIHVPGARRLVLQAGPAEAGGAAYDDQSPIARICPGDKGTVEGMCRPVGKVRFGDDLLDAVTQGEMIEAGATVRVLRRDGNRVVVEENETTEPQS